MPPNNYDQHHQAADIESLGDDDKLRPGVVARDDRRVLILRAGVYSTKNYLCQRTSIGCTYTSMNRSLYVQF